MITPKMLYVIITEAEARVSDKTLPLEARIASRETAAIAYQRMYDEGVDSVYELKDMKAFKSCPK